MYYMILESSLMLLTFSGAAAIMDLKCGIIPNSLTVSAAVCGLASGLMTGGPRGLLFSAAGLILPLLLLSPLYLAGMMGAGDIKLLAASGSFLGPGLILRGIFWSLLFGAALSAFLMIRRKNFFSRFHYLFEYICTFARTGEAAPYLDDVGEDGRMCFALPVFLAMAALAAGLV